MRRLVHAGTVTVGLGSVVAARSDELRYVAKHEELKCTFGGMAPTHRPKPGTRIVQSPARRDCRQPSATEWARAHKPVRQTSPRLASRHRGLPVPRVLRAQPLERRWRVGLGEPGEVPERPFRIGPVCSAVSIDR